MIKNCFNTLMMAGAICFSSAETIIANEKTSEFISLNLNENPFGTFPSIELAMKMELMNVSQYSMPIKEEFMNQLAFHHAIEVNQIFISSGLSTVIYVITDALLEPGKKLIMAEPTFELIENIAKVRGTKVVKVPLRQNYEHNLNEMLAHVDSSTQLVYICNPNNPTGSLTPRAKIEDFIKKLPPHVYVFIDEAYHHFAEGSKDYVSFIEKPLVDDRIIVGRSFSKVYGLAGMRLGYVVSTPKTIKKLSLFSHFDSVSRVTLRGGTAALQDEMAWKEMTQKFKDANNEFCKQAKARGINYIPTFTNFIMLETGGRKVQDVIQHFKSNNIHIGRKFPHMDEHVRISFGTPAQMQKFWQVWDKMK